MTFLQKEQSLISNPNYSNWAMTAAMGYQCYSGVSGDYNGNNCKDSTEGFAKQVEYGSWQLRYNYERAQDTGFSDFQVGQTFYYNYDSNDYCISNNDGSLKTSGDHSGIFSNRTTASIYRYTPYVFNNAFNTWDVFNNRYNIVSPSAKPLPVINYIYRFWSDKYLNHFYTVDINEKNYLINHDPDWRYEEVAGTAASSGASGTVPVYRFWSDNFHAHFYTADPVERDQLINNDRNWRYEQIAYYASSSASSNFNPVYRFWSDNFHAHFYTADPVERDQLINNDRNWRYEQIAYYLPR